jgi:predicted LPLAT superfamily acyltransferase
MGLDDQHLAPATGKQSTRRQSSNTGPDDHDVVIVIVARPSAEIRHVPCCGVAVGECCCYHATGTIKRGAPMPGIFARRMFVRPAAEPVEGLRPGWSAFGEHREPKLCAVVPSRNHCTALGTISATLKGHGLKVFIIDDGSDEPARSSIAALHAPARSIEVIRLTENQGKGGAVATGLRHAFERGFTHAVQVDADGQHDLRKLTALIEAALAHPDALISGRPIFDASARRSRLLSRWLTHVWVWVETLSIRIRDSMCGFRVYPLAATLAVLDSEKVGRCMDFDVEIMVRLFWRGVPVVDVPVTVTYPEGNKSNFRMFYDNVLITRMHTRLVFTMLLRMPSILRNRPPATEAPGHWVAIGERGAYCGIKLLSLTYALLGRRGCLTLMWPIVAYFHLTGGKARGYSIAYLRRVHARKGLPPPTWWDSLRHFMSFATKALDTFIARSAPQCCGPIAVNGGEELDRLSAEGKGVLLIVSHLGNSELSRACLSERFRKIINALVYTRHAALYNRIVKIAQPDVEAHTIQVTEVGPATAVVLKERIERGEWIAIAGDRTPLAGEARCSRVAFLGDEAPFSHGPYVLGALMGCPVYLMFCLREGDGHAVYFEHFADRIELPRRNRTKFLAELAARYAQRLEHHCLRSPMQFYNFFDFWSSPVGTAPGAVASAETV